MGDLAKNANEQSADIRRFAAFISYSHADAEAAARLQRKLERYRLPKRATCLHRLGPSSGIAKTLPPHPA